MPHFFFRTGFRTQISLLFFFLAFSLSVPPQNRSPKMSGLVGEFVKGLRGLKVKELAPYVGGYARTNLTPGALYGRAYEHIHLYKKHLDQGSVKPLFDTMGLLFVGAYALAWPTVRMEGGREREKMKDLRRASTMGFSLSSLAAPSSFALLSFSHCCTRFLPYLSGPLSRECGRVAAGVVEKTRKRSQARIFGDKERPFGPPPFFFLFFSSFSRRRPFFFFQPRPRPLLFTHQLALFSRFRTEKNDTQEYAHYKAEQEAKLKGESGGH